jgi:hypothetical protein
MRKTNTAIVLIGAALLSGCDDERDTEIRRLNGVIRMIANESAILRQNLPTEQPAVVAELDAAKRRIDELEAKLSAAKSATAEQVVPIAVWIREVDEKLAGLRRDVNRKSDRGHSHDYSGGKHGGRTSPD